MQKSIPLQKGTGDASQQKWSLLDHQVSLPAAVIYESRLQHNVQWMQTFADHFKVRIAPHGKTTMAPDLFQQQMDAGAWGMTLATATQVTVAFNAGVRKVIMANQLLGRHNMEIISQCLADETFEFYCLVDSIDNIKALAQFFLQKHQKLNVLLEIGVTGARCGIRDKKQAQALLREIALHPSLCLAGIETYEGVIGLAHIEQHSEHHQEKHEEKSLAKRVHQHIHDVKEYFLELLHADVFTSQHIILTGAGSAWYDIVAETFAEVHDPRVIPIIRPGCYIVHDQGLCQVNQDALIKRLQQTTLTHPIRGDLKSALEIWTYVQSIPEPGLAIVTMGKRDVAFDADFPIPTLHYRDSFSRPEKTPTHWYVTSMMDQHTALKIGAYDDIKVGDIIAFATSHPCLTFDKWRNICIMDDNYKVIRTIKTYF